MKLLKKIDFNKSFSDFQKNKNFFRSFDFIIIGSGPASAVLSFFLQEKKKKFLVIEKGNFDNGFNSKIKSLAFKINQESRIFKVGGSGNLWANIYSKFENYEFYNRFNNKRYKLLWPCSFQNLQKYYRKIDKKFGFNLKKIFFNQKYLKENFKLRMFSALKIPYNFKYFFEKKIKNFFLLYNCEVLEINESTKGAELQIRNSKNQKIDICGKKLILCNGGLESIRLVLKSLKVKKLKNLKNKRFVGRFFMDHPKGYVGILKYPKKKYLNYFSLNFFKKYIQYIGLSLSPNEQIKKKLTNSYVRFEMQNSKTQKILNYFKDKCLNIKTYNFPKYLIRIFLEMEPRFTNFVKLDKNNNLVIKLELSKKDLYCANLLLKKIYYYFSFNYKKENIKKITSADLTDASHHMGGLIYPKIVDKNLKLNGLKNIYVCSSAIFPTSGSANPTLTICALACRLAKHLNKI